MNARNWLLGALAAIAMAGSGCGSDSATAPTTTSPVTDTWSAMLGPGGAESRSVPASKSGTVTLTLIGADVPLTIGIGIPRQVNAGCRLTVSTLATSPGTSIATDVPYAGSYCVEIFDEANNIAKQATFTASVVYP
ncbi:MAG TPA: hypothetical protein VL173_05395 [Vicinamibacterales bacterium]|jgi:hypothetical protein|nr:hypothetical protein [Vicinamibacterales bacterium]